MDNIILVTKYQLHYYNKNMSFTQSENVIQLGAARSGTGAKSPSTDSQEDCILI